MKLFNLADALLDEANDRFAKAEAFFKADNHESARQDATVAKILGSFAKAISAAAAKEVE